MPRLNVAAKKFGPGPDNRLGPAQEAAEDATLLAKVVAGDAAAFRTITERHLSAVLALARRMLRDDAEAEDIAQETMLRLWRSSWASSWATTGCGHGCAVSLQTSVSTVRDPANG